MIMVDKYKWFVVVGVLAVLTLFILGKTGFLDNVLPTVDLSEKQTVKMSPTQVESIKSIGQWEFLAISNEEIMDTVRQHKVLGHVVSEDELTRIYKGTLRLGIDMRKLKEGWIEMQGDTAVAVIPDIELLDKDFIDEAGTESFYENGNWTPQDKAQMTQRAIQKMKIRCMTKENIAIAENNAKQQIEVLLRSFGFKYSKVMFEREVVE